MQALSRREETEVNAIVRKEGQKICDPVIRGEWRFDLTCVTSNDSEA